MACVSKIKEKSVQPHTPTLPLDPTGSPITKSRETKGQLLEQPLSTVNDYLSPQAPSPYDHTPYDDSLYELLYPEITHLYTQPEYPDLLYPELIHLYPTKGDLEATYLCPPNYYKLPNCDQEEEPVDDHNHKHVV